MKKYLRGFLALALVLFVAFAAAVSTFATQSPVAQIGETTYGSLKEAMSAAVNGDTVTLLDNITVDSETYTIADGVAIKLDMNGKKITVTDNKTSNFELFYIYGELTVTGNGTIELTSTTNRAWNAMSAIFHNRGGVLNIENGTFQNLGGTDMAWVVDNSGNYYGDATTNISGGTLTSTYTAIRNRMEQNSHGASGTAILNITGGEIKGTTRAIWAQAASASTTAPATGEINIRGGNVGFVYTACSAGAECMTTISGGTVAEFKGEVGELIVTGDGQITGDVTILTASGAYADYEVNENGEYIVATHPVKLGNTGYDSLAEAVAAAQAGDVITLLTDVDLTAEVRAEMTMTIDLGGHTLTSTGCRALHAYRAGTVLTVKNGTVKSNYSGALTASYNGKLILGENLTVVSTGNYGVFINRGKLEVSEASVNVTGATRAIGIKAHDDNELIIKGGTYSHAVSSDFIPEGYAGIWVTDGENTVYTVVGAVKVEDTNGVNYYENLAAAAAAAADGATITLLDDIVLTDDDIVMVGNHKVLANVTAKDVTLDLNGKTVDVQYAGGAYLIAVIRVADGAELTVTGDGAIDVNENGVNVAYMFWKAGSTGYLTIDNGTYHMDDAGDSMVYTNGSEIVTVNGGSFTLDAVGTRANGFPCIFNAQGQNTKNIIVNGGTFNDDIQHQYYPFEVQMDKTLALSETDGIYTVVPAMAYVTEIVGNYINEVGYTSFAAAFKAAGDGEKITLLATDYLYVSDGELKDFDGSYSTFFEVNGKTLTIDLNGYRLHGNTKGAETLVLGMFATNDNGHLILEDSSEAKTGTVQISSQGANVYALLVNYEPGCTITINGGNYNLNKATDCLLYTGCNEGLIVNGGNFTLGNVGTGRNGSPWIFNALGQNTRHAIVNGGTFNADIQHQYYPFEVLVPKELALDKSVEGLYTIVPAVAWVNEQEWSSKWYTNEVGYATLEEAFAAVSAEPKTKVYYGKTYVAAQEYVTVLNAQPEDVKDILANTQAGDVIAIPAGTYTSFPASSLKEGVTVVCPEGTVFEGTSSLDINGATVIGATFSNESGKAVGGTINGTFKDCTFTGSNALRYCYAGETVVFENCVFSGDVYGIHFDGGANDVIFRNCTFSGFNAMGGAITKLTMEGCTFVANDTSNYNGINLWGNTELIGCTFIFDGSVDYEWIDLCGENKTATFTNCVVTDGTTTTDIATVVTKRHDSGKIIVNGVEL